MEKNCSSEAVFQSFCTNLYFFFKNFHPAFILILKFLEDLGCTILENSISLFFLIGGSTDGKQAEEQSAAATGEESYPFCREPSYFEIPTKEAQQHSQTPEGTIHEIPTKDTHIAGAGHASFTIEFDNSTPGKVTIKDHVTKFTPDQRPKPKKSPSGAQDLSGLQTVMMAPESKVANWLAQNNPPTMMWEASEEDSKSIKSDVPVYLKRLKGKINNFSFISFALNT